MKAKTTKKKRAPRKRGAKSWVAWVGFSDGVPHVFPVCDSYCGIAEESQEMSVYARKGDAKKRYEDYRRVRFTEEPS